MINQVFPLAFHLGITTVITCHHSAIIRQDTSHRARTIMRLNPHNYSQTIEPPEAQRGFPGFSEEISQKWGKRFCLE